MPESPNTTHDKIGRATSHEDLAATNARRNAQLKSDHEYSQKRTAANAERNLNYVGDDEAYMKEVSRIGDVKRTNAMHNTAERQKGSGKTSFEAYLDREDHPE